MKKMTLLATAAIMVCSCGADKGSDAKNEMPKPGTLIDSASMPVRDDSLNSFRFSIKVIADSAIKDGVYAVDVDYGPNFAEGKFTMPKGGEQLRPVIRKGAAPSTYVVGFMMPNDTTFYDYYEVSCNKGSTKMQYTKAYTF